MDPSRRQEIFETFILHFIDMAKKSANFRSFNQSMIYLKQVERLCNILQDDKLLLSIEKSNKYREIIIPIQNKVLLAMNRDYAVPELPRRESMLEPKLRSRLPSVRPKKIDEDVDPYTNIEALKLEKPLNNITNGNTKNTNSQATAIQPTDFNINSSDDDDNDDIATELKQPTREKNTQKKSIVMNGFRQNAPKKSITIVEKVLVHTIPNNNKNHKSNNEQNNNNYLADILGNVDINDIPDGDKPNSNSKMISDNTNINNRRPSSMKVAKEDLIQVDKQNNNNKNNKIILTNGYGHDSDEDIDTSF